MKSTGKILAVLFFLFFALSCSHDGPAGQDDIFSDISYRDLVSVPGGLFMQRSSTGFFNHTLSSFKIGKHEVTYELWYEVRSWAENNGYEFANTGREGSNGTDGDQPTAAKDEPVTMISWRDAIVWCNAYSEMAGLTPVYTYNGNTIKSATAEVGADFIADLAVENWTTADGYRLPSEGEWRYAAGYIDGDSWTGYDYASGAAAYWQNADATKAVAWYDANSDTGSGKKAQTVGTKTPNALGIHDMSGNVFEWCWDLQADYPLSSEVDYRGPNSGTLRIMRGGSYDHTASYMRIGYRAQQNPNANISTIGFRVAKTE